MAGAELLYFEGRGNAEVTRLMYAAANASAKLNDRRYAVDFPRFGEGIAVRYCAAAYGKVASPDFWKAKQDGTLAANMDRAPVLVIDGVSIGQSTAVERLVAKRLGFYGGSDIEAAQIDMLVEHVADIRKTYHDAKKKKQALAEGAGEEDPVAQWFASDLPTWFQKLEACLGPNTGFAVGAKTSWADAKLYVFIREYFDNLEGINAAIEACPKIVAAVNGFAAIPSIVDYLAARKPTPM